MQQTYRAKVLVGNWHEQQAFERVGKKWDNLFQERRLELAKKRQQQLERTTSKMVVEKVFMQLLSNITILGSIISHFWRMYLLRRCRCIFQYKNTESSYFLRCSRFLK